MLWNSFINYFYRDNAPNGQIMQIVLIHVQEYFQDDIDRGDCLTMSVDTKIRNAIQVARKFLEQYNSLVVFKSASLNDEICNILMDIGLTHEKIVHVRINTIMGTIVEFTQ